LYLYVHLKNAKTTKAVTQSCI